MKSRANCRMCLQSCDVIKSRFILFVWCMRIKKLTTRMACRLFVRTPRERADLGVWRIVENVHGQCTYTIGRFLLFISKTLRQVRSHAGHVFGIDFARHRDRRRVRFVGKTTTKIGGENLVVRRDAKCVLLLRCTRGIVRVLCGTLTGGGGGNKIA